MVLHLHHAASTNRSSTQISMTCSLTMTLPLQWTLMLRQLVYPSFPVVLCQVPHMKHPLNCAGNVAPLSGEQCDGCVVCDAILVQLDTQLAQVSAVISAAML